MKNRWRDEDAARFVAEHARQWGEDLSLRTYSTRLLGADDGLVLHGGGNTSVKGTHRNLLGEPVSAIFVKASGSNMATIEPEGHPGLDLECLR
ncbi:MAG: bifunctional aldolase/short-chain dehydrogenase, partial [Acidobacteria bacterium]